MRNVLLYMSMSLDEYVASDREHPGVAIAEDAELRQWKVEHIRMRLPLHPEGPSRVGSEERLRTAAAALPAFWMKLTTN